MKDKELGVQCCFCGQGLSFDKAIEIAIRIDKGTNEEQAVYAHANVLIKFCIQVYREDLQ